MSFKQKPLVLAIALTLTSTVTFSQTDNELGAVTVYGSRFQETIDQALPQTTIVTATEIQKSGLMNISEVLKNLGNLNTRQNLDGSSNAVIDMRGFGGAADNNVVVLLDGVRLSENEQTSARTSFIPLEAIDHIEITKGGNAVLYGDGATSGSINIVLKKNVGNLTAVSAGIASYSGYQSNIYHSEDLGKEQLGIFARQEYSNGYRDNSKTSEQSAGLNLTSQIDASSTVGLRVIGSQEKNKLPGALPMAYLNSAPQASQVPGYSSNMDVKTSNITIFGSTKFENIELGIDINQMLKDNRWAYNYDASSVYAGYDPSLHPNQSPIAWGTTNSHSKTQQVNPRVKLSDFGLTGNTFIVGYDWLSYKQSADAYKTDSDSSYYSSSFNSYNINDGSYGNKSFKTQAWYARSDWQVNASDRLTIGGRRQLYEQASNQNYYNGGNLSTCSPYYCDPFNVAFSNQGHASAYDAQWTRKYTTALTSYMRISQNFRFANLDDNAQAPYAQNNNLIPQISHDYEIGAKWNTFVWKIDTKIFKSFINNEIGFDGTNNINYSPTIHEGAEANIKYQISRDYLLKTNIQLIKAQFADGIYTGKYIPNVAKINALIGIDYRVNAKETFGISSRFSGNSYASNDLYNQQYKNPGYAVADLSYIYLEKKWSVTAAINNILDKNYTDSSIYKSAYNNLYKMTTYPNPGRNFSLTGRYVF